ncbi:hypothetical protein [Winogradskya humida]|uniref:Uncharacterized protein n=1 Tax=Winogradskya humida TaxID=113566 RepID=A0ABQ3ZX46_9ACTN|nr:hypothetical protein [Actinoplanes humidus]GIE23149.1 hypothetical protein Ahu01nite_062510 [Actinoplanes humidus]
MPVSHPIGTTLRDVSGDSFSDTDRDRLADTISTARNTSTASATALLAPAVPGGASAALTARSCVFDHCGVLLFPRSLDAGLSELDRLGLEPQPITPSTVVRRRLASRYDVDPDACDVAITRLRLDLPDGRRHAAVEVFLLPRDSAGYERRIEDAEAAQGFEQHTAFVVTRPDATLLTRLITTWRTDAGLLAEGGGHNPYEGSTVFYFVREPAHPGERRRFELHCTGDFRAVLDGLAVESGAVARAYRDWRPAARTTAV